jgi:hypothetical protein
MIAEVGTYQSSPQVGQSMKSVPLWNIGLNLAKENGQTKRKQRNASLRTLIFLEHSF